MMVTSNRIEIDKKRVCHYLGYGTNGTPPARILSLIDEYVEEAYDLIEPSYSYVIRDIERVHDSSVFIDGSIVFESEVIARLLGECDKVAVFLATIGDYLEEIACWLAKHRLVLQATLVDAIGSDAVEKVADSVQGKIGELANKQGLGISRRFSPGYCDWDISQQKMVFRTMNGDSPGVRLGEECLMVPKKSISGIIGIGPSSSDVEEYNPCRTCNKRDCPGRR